MHNTQQWTLNLTKKHRGEFIWTTFMSPYATPENSGRQVPKHHYSCYIVAGANPNTAMNLWAQPSTYYDMLHNASAVPDAISFRMSTSK